MLALCKALLLQGIEIRHKLLNMVLLSSVGHAHVRSLGVVGTAPQEQRLVGSQGAAN
jgi:hypothetical protein